jgi:hypothetical protein
LDTVSDGGLAGYQLFYLALVMLCRGLMITVLAVLGIIAASLVIGLIVTAKAPVGYEDETGFHFGQEAGAVQHAEVPSYTAPVPKPV